MKIGLGFDLHRLEVGHKLIIGGVDIPFGKGLVGHSDADVLLHAICDSLLGAAALGDIGEHFPDTDKKYLGISSRELLICVGGKINNVGYRVCNMDCTIIAEKPKLNKFFPEMIKNISSDLDINPSQVNIKATTTEKIGAIGRGEGIAAEAISLLEST